MIETHIFRLGGRRLYGAFLAVGFVGCLMSARAQEWALTSPNGLVKLSVKLGAQASAGNQRSVSALAYRVELGSGPERAQVIDFSPLGLRFHGRNFAEDLRFDKAQAEKSVEASYTLLHGKRKQCRNQARELTLAFLGGDGQPLELDLRAYDDGVAFRYRLPGKSEGNLTLESEATGFTLPGDAKLWCAPSDKASTYSPAYETYYESGMAAGTPSPLGFGWSFPLLFCIGNSQAWCLITEANVDSSFCGSRLRNSPSNNLYQVVLPIPQEGNGQGSPNPSSALPWEMPWRVIILGKSLGAILESTLVTDVCPSSRVEDTSWIKPGRVAWSWWSDNPSPKDAGKQCQFVDLAAEMGWEYLLVDANWTIMENGNIQEVLKHAKEKGVGVLLWYNSGGPHNVVTEKPRDCLTYPPVRQFELGLLQQWGVKGIKVDFFQSDKQDVMGVYQGIMKDAAEKKIMVNFHGCTLPRGWERTYPHLMSMEAVRGEECYLFDDKFPERAPVQNTILPFTRNAVGPMDYTPAGFSNGRYPHLTTWAHELALTVVFESGWLHFADRVEAYRSLAPAPKQFLKEVPVVWEDTRFVAGYPGQYVILARRSGSTWYLAGVNGQNQAREEKIQPGNWLKAGDYELAIIGDGGDAHSFASFNKPFKAGESVTVKIAPRGGFVGVLRAKP